MPTMKACENCGEPFRVFPTTMNKRRFCSAECSARYRTEHEVERFWSHVRKGPGCWEWTGGRNDWGYGTFAKYRDRSSPLAHRYSFVLANGPIPDGLLVLHRCDNPCCVNPEHLYAGTNQDNMNDREERGRGSHLRGSSHGMSKLSEADVLAIRASYVKRGLPGKHAPQLAAEYGVSVPTIYDIVHGRHWRHLA
jgi:hypothetical protein